MSLPPVRGGFPLICKTNSLLTRASDPKRILLLRRDREFYEPRLWRRGKIGNFYLPYSGLKVLQDIQDYAIGKVGRQV
jgi:hypothetical protein